MQICFTILLKKPFILKVFGNILIQEWIEKGRYQMLAKALMLEIIQNADR